MPELMLLGISGSMRRESNNTAVLRTLQMSMPPGIGLSVVTLDDIPPYNQDVELCGVPPGVQRLKSAIEASDGIILCSPEYNHGMPGVLKNALDWVSRPALISPMKGKPVLIVTSSPAFTGGVRAQAQLKETLSGMLARVIAWPQVVIAGVHDKVREGRLVDEASVKFLLDAVSGLAAEIAVLARTPSATAQT